MYMRAHREALTPELSQERGGVQSNYSKIQIDEDPRQTQASVPDTRSTRAGLSTPHTMLGSWHRRFQGIDSCMTSKFA